MKYRSILTIACIGLGFASPIMAQESADETQAEAPATEEEAVKRTHIEILKDVIAQVGNLNDALKSITTAESADITAGRIETIVGTLTQLDAEAKELGDPSEEMDKDLNKMADDLKALGKIFFTQLDRIDEASIESEKLERALSKFLELTQWEPEEEPTEEKE